MYISPKRILLLLVLAASPVAAETFSWTHDGKAEDGQSVTLTEFRIYCYPTNTTRTVAPSATTSGSARTLTYAVPSGDMTCVMTAFGNGSESAPSNEVRVRAVSPTVPANMRCDISTYAVAPNGSYTTRPLYNQPNGTRIGNVEIKMPDGTPRVCEGGVALLVTTSGEWRYTTNNAGLRGAALCRRQ